MKFKVTQKFFLIVIFLLVIYLPIILSPFSSPELVSYSENRIKTSLPVYNISRVLEAQSPKRKLIAAYLEGNRFKSSLDSYFKENFALRDQYLSLYSSYKFYLLNISPYPEKAILGRDGWLYIGNSNSDCLLESYGLKQLSEAELDKLCDYLSEISNWADGNKISFYFAIAPEKQTVYPQFLPLIKSGESVADQLRKKLRDRQINVIDLEDGLKDNRTRLYHKTDSHWNDFGAFCGTQVLLRAIQKKFSAVIPLNTDDYTMDSTSSYAMDLSRMLSLRMKEVQITFKSKAVSSVRKKNKRLNVPNDFRYDPDIYESRFENDRASGKIIYLHDSFAIAMMQFISTSFKESVFIWDYTFDKELILKEKPDIVVLQVVERKLDEIVPTNWEAIGP